MGYLNNQVVTVDAILTKKGRELLAKGDGSFNITQFALSDDEVDYTLYNPNHPSGSAYYGEAIEKTFLPPLRVYALVTFEGIKTETSEFGVDKIATINVKFHKRRLGEDQDLFVREGDFVLYGDIFYEITELNEPKQLFGQIDFRYEIEATCIRARKGKFDAT